MSLEFEAGFDFAALESRLEAAVPVALMAGGEHIGEQADLRAPVLVNLKRANKRRRADPGELLRSRFVRLVGNDVAVGYSAYWAKWNHERLDYHHDIGEAKWLERTMAAETDEALRITGRKLKEQL